MDRQVDYKKMGRYFLRTMVVFVSSVSYTTVYGADTNTPEDPQITESSGHAASPNAALTLALVSQDKQDADNRRALIRAAQQQRQAESNDDAATRRKAQMEATRQGRAQGAYDGQRAGFQSCQAEAQRNAFQRGYSIGWERGQSDGTAQGRQQGANEGRADGIREGRSDGQRRARDRAGRDARAPARQEGRREALGSSAGQRGLARGAEDADSDALAQAQTVDYRRGRSEYREQRLSQASAITSELNFSKRLNSSLARDGSDKLGRVINPDVPDEFEAVNPSDAAKSSARNAYRETYQSAYQASYRTAEQEGCQQARNLNYSRNHSSGERQGYAEGRDDGYRRAYDYSYRQSYDSQFPRESRAAYQMSYQRFYSQSYDTQRQQAFQEEYDSIYQAAYAQEYEQKFEVLYAEYAAVENERGRLDERDEFSERPIRFNGRSRINESLDNGIFEPEENLSLDFNLRNFSNASIPGSDLVLELKTSRGGAVDLSDWQVSMPVDIEPNSITSINEVFSFAMTQDAVGQNTDLRIEVHYRGALIDSHEFSIEAKYPVTVEFLNIPPVGWGVTSQLPLRFTNQSEAEIMEGALVSVRSLYRGAEVVNSDVVLPGLSPGAEAMGEIEFVLRGTESLIEIPFETEVVNGAGKVLNLQRTMLNITIENEYEVVVLNDDVESLLRSPGEFNIHYSVENKTSLEIDSGLQLDIDFSENLSTSHQILGVVPQFLRPLKKGEDSEFIIPVRVVKSADHGFLEIILKENGTPVYGRLIEF